MLELFKDEIPKIEKLRIVIEQMIRNTKYSLEDIREEIVDHISECQEIHPDDYEKLGEASSVAYNVIDNLIDDLEETETNCKRIKDYIGYYHSYNGFNRLIVDFEEIVTDEEKRRLIDEGRRIFVSELTEHWK
jgi:hypothetical protein